MRETTLPLSLPNTLDSYLLLMMISKSSFLQSRAGSTAGKRLCMEQSPQIIACQLSSLKRNSTGWYLSLLPNLKTEREHRLKENAFRLSELFEM